MSPPSYVRGQTSRPGISCWLVTCNPPDLNPPAPLVHWWYTPPQGGYTKPPWPGSMVRSARTTYRSPCGRDTGVAREKVLFSATGELDDFWLSRSHPTFYFMLVFHDLFFMKTGGEWFPTRSQVCWLPPPAPSFLSCRGRSSSSWMCSSNPRSGDLV